MVVKSSGAHDLRTGRIVRRFGPELDRALVGRSEETYAIDIDNRRPFDAIERILKRRENVAQPA